MRDRRLALRAAREILLAAKANGGTGLQGVWEYLRDQLDAEEVDTREVYWATENGDAVARCTVHNMLANDDFGEFAQVLPHIERGEVCTIGGGASPLMAVWMDCTGDGNPYATFADAMEGGR
jgi:hypothetical protein